MQQNRIAAPFARYIESLDIENIDLLMGISSLFTSNNKLVTHIGIFDDSQPPSKDLMLYEKEHLKDTRIMEYSNFMSSPELVRMYKCEKSNLKKDIENIDGQQKEIIASFSLPNKAPGIIKSIMNDMGDIQELGTPLIFANISGDRCSILGFEFLTSTLNQMNDDQLQQLHYTGDLIVEHIHHLIRRRANYSVKVYASIFDRISSDGISMPGDFLTMERGILSDPVPISFSPKIADEISVLDDTEFILFRDKENLLLTIKEGGFERLIRLPFSQLIDSNGKIKSSRIITVINRNLAIARNKDGVSMSSIKTQLVQGLTDNISTVGLAIKLRSIGGEFGDGHTMVNEEESLIYAQIIPLLLHLLFAKYCKPPDLWNPAEIRKAQDKNQIKNTKSPSKHSRVLHWGSDDIRYIRIGKGHSVSRHWVSSFVRTTPLKRKETIARYREKRWPIYRKGNQTFGGTFVSAHFRGMSGKSNWDGEYNFGKKGSGPYSQKAISWLQSIERKEGIIIQHAESGGERCIPLENGGRIHLDGWCEETNTAYEFHGDVWHGNPKIFSPDEYCHPHNKEWTAGELFEKTRLREQVIRDLGIKLVTKWESEWDEEGV